MLSCLERISINIDVPRMYVLVVLLVPDSVLYVLCEFLQAINYFNNFLNYNLLFQNDYVQRLKMENGCPCYINQ